MTTVVKCPRILEIYVGPEEIAAGLPCDGWQCPIALAMKKALDGVIPQPFHVIIDPRYARIIAPYTANSYMHYSTTLTQSVLIAMYSLPPGLTVWLQSFDSKMGYRNMSPIKAIVDRWSW